MFCDLLCTIYLTLCVNKHVYNRFILGMNIFTCIKKYCAPVYTLLLYIQGHILKVAN